MHISQASLIIGALVIVSACANTAPPFTNEACGTEPTQQQIDSAVKTYMATTNWKDPDSVRWRNANAICRARWIGKGVFARDRKTAWEIDLDVNAKNSYGGYTGFQTKSITLTGEERD